VNTQPEIKSRCQELLKEQEMGRREIRKLISKATDPTKCLKAWGWTFTEKGIGGQWFKIFTLPHPLLLRWYEQVCLCREVSILLDFSNYCVTLWIKPHPKFEGAYYWLDISFAICPPISKLKTSFIFQEFAEELPKIIASVETESFYDTAKQKQIKVISGSELRTKIKQALQKIGGTVGAKLAR
jgi:hypothetical protein